MQVLVAQVLVTQVLVAQVLAAQVFVAQVGVRKFCEGLGAQKWVRKFRVIFTSASVVTRDLRGIVSARFGWHGLRCA